MIKIGNNDISLKLGSANVSAAYLGSVQVYGGGGYDLCYGVADDINTYSARTFSDVYDKTSGKWYKLNNLQQYEEYGVYGSGRTITTYTGKLTIDDGYEYKYSGGTWVSIGAVSGSTAELPDVPFSLNYNAKEYDSTTKTFTKTTGQLVDTDAVIANGTPVEHDDYVTVYGGTYAPITGYQTYINRSTSTPNLTIISKQRTATDTNCHLFGNRSGAGDYNWMYRPTTTKLAFHGSSQINGTTTTTQPVIEGIRVDSSRVIKFDNYTDNTTTSAAMFSYGNNQSSGCALFAGYSTGSTTESFAGDFYWIYISQNTLTDEQVQQVIEYNENGSTIEYPEYYTDKADPANNLTFNTLADAEAYAYTNCVYDGMVAKIGGVRYVFDSEEGWVEAGSFADEYLTFVPAESCTFTWSGTTSNNAISYSTDNGATWSTPAQTATVTTAGNVLWKGTFVSSATRPFGTGTFTTSGDFEVEGNIMSLLYSDNFTGQTSLGNTYYTFYQLFYGSAGITSAENLVLPATTLTNSCYNAMFQNCTSLTIPPALPATTLTNYCYQDMFNGCTSLTTTPVLSATTLTDSCYNYMFQYCTSLTTAPELPATTLANNCYYQMFLGCTNLTTAPELPATTLAINCYRSMFQDCTHLTTAPELPATTLANNCYNGMFKGCTSITTAPVLSATTLANNCYNSMFNGCTSLTTAPELPASTLVDGCYDSMFSSCASLTAAPELPATTLAQQCYYGMFYGCTSLTTAPELPATTLKYNCYYMMFYNCTSLTTAPQLPATTLASNCYNYMFYGCTSLTTAPQLPATTLANKCYSSMFSRCTSLTTAPQLPATTLTDSCYREMFMNCTSLTTAPELPATTLTFYCYGSMFQGCASLTTAPELPATTLANNCYYGMFRFSSKVSSITCLATDISASNCVYNWTDGVKSTGTFTKAASMTSWTTGSSGIPSNWTVVDA